MLMRSYFGMAVTINTFLSAIQCGRSIERHSPSPITENSSTYTELVQDAPQLADLFAGRAYIKPILESEAVSLRFHPESHVSVAWDLKLKIFLERNGKVFSYVRGYRTGLQGVSDHYNIFLVESLDGRNFVQSNPLPAFQLDPDASVYDPFVSYDPNEDEYIMTTECALNSGAEKTAFASLCFSKTRTPLEPGSWSPLKVLVEGVLTPIVKSASSGVVLIDGKKRYVAWDELDFRERRVEMDGKESTATKAISWSTGDTRHSILDIDASAYIQRPQPKPFCSDAWDCNNRAMSDWIVERDHNTQEVYYYSVYNGANFFIATPYVARISNRWGISIARSKIPIGQLYRDTLADNLVVKALRKDTGGISYPTVSKVQGKWYVYYAYNESDGCATPRQARSEIVFGNASVPPVDHLRSHSFRNVPFRALTLRHSRCMFWQHALTLTDPMNAECQAAATEWCAGGATTAIPYSSGCINIKKSDPTVARDLGLAIDCYYRK